MTLPQRPDHACWHISTSLVCWRMCAQEAHIKYLRKRWREQSERWQHANISVRKRKKTREKGKAESGLHTTATLMWFFLSLQLYYWAWRFLCDHVNAGTHWWRFGGSVELLNLPHSCCYTQEDTENLQFFSLFKTQCLFCSGTLQWRTHSVW